MGLLDGIKGAVGALSRAWSSYGGGGFARFRALLPGARIDHEREAGDLWRNSTVAICLKWIGDNYPKPTIRVARLNRRGEWTPLAKHEAIDLIRRPNPWQSGRTLAKGLSLSLTTDGNGYLVIFEGLGTSRPRELWWVPHYDVDPCWPEDGSEFISHYMVRIDGIQFRVECRNMLHFRDGIDPRNPRLGIAALKSQLREICSDNEISGYTAAIMRNLGVPGLVIQGAEGSGPGGKPTHMNAEKGERIRERLRDMLSGEGRGDALVLRGNYKIDSVGLSPEQLRLDKIPPPIQAKICAAMGLSPMVLGLPDPMKTYSNMAEARRGAWENCLVPLQELVAEVFTFFLLPRFGEDAAKARIEWDYTHVESLQEAQDLKANRFRGLWTDGLITRNEAREALGFEPDPDGDLFVEEVATATVEDPELADGDPEDLDQVEDDDDPEDDDDGDGTASTRSKPKPPAKPGGKAARFARKHWPMIWRY